MNIHVEENPNYAGNEQFVFNELGQSRPVRALVAEIGGKETVCEVTGVDTDGRWVWAYGLKIADSSEGHAFLIYGGAWGIRLKKDARRPWDLSDKEQWGEAFKIYGSEQDILYAEK